MAEIAITVVDPAGNRFARRVDNYALVRHVLPTFVKELGLPSELYYHLIPAGTRSKLPIEKSLVSCSVRPGAELLLIPVRDAVFERVTQRLYDEAQQLLAADQQDLAHARLDQLFRVLPDHPDPAGLRDLVPGQARQPQPAEALPEAVEEVEDPRPTPSRTREPVASRGGGGCMGVILVGLCILAGASRVIAAEPIPVRLTTDGSFKQNLQWSPDGKTLLFTRIHQGKMALWTMSADGGELKRLLPEHKEPHFDGHYSPDGKRIVYVYDNLQGTDGKLRINICSADGADDKTLVPHKAFEESPRWSPNGKLVLWVSTRDKNPDLYTVDAEGKNEKRLTSDPAYDLHPAWSPDGKRIVFASGRSGRQKLHLMNADGSDVKKLTDGEFLDAWPTWRPGGKQIAFVSNRAGNYDLWLMNADGTAPVNLTDHEAQDTSPAWSPDGKRLAFVSTRDGGSDIYVIDVK
jgi:TolB protein